MGRENRDLIDFLMEDDEKFYEHYLSRLTKEEYEKFLEENPEFCIKEPKAK